MLQSLIRWFKRLRTSLSDDTHDTRGEFTPSETSMMPDEALVLRLLHGNDGHMWQGDIASELEWSPSKTSRLLSALEDDDSIARRQVGREKIVYLPQTIPENFFDNREASAIDR